MADVTQTVLTVGIPTLAVLMGILVNNSRFNDINSRFNDLNTRFNDLNSRLGEFRDYVDSRFNTMESVFTEKLLRVEQVMGARLKHLEDNR